MSMSHIDGRTAWERLLHSPQGRWSHDIARFKAPLADVLHTPKFAIARDAKFFCIGSCFARNIEEHLVYCGIEVLSKRIVSPEAEWRARPNGLVNKFTTASMLNELVDVVDGPPIDAALFEQRGDHWADLQLCPGVAAVTLDRAIERRSYLRSSYFSRLRQADIVIATLGLVEVWHDSTTRRFLNAPPSYASVKRTPERYTLHTQTVDENLSMLERIKATIETLRPGARLILTVSPVPMSETFSGQDILVANTNSKAVLRAAAAMFAAGRPDVDYFPSFDMIAAMPRATAYKDDCLHVSDPVVGEVIRKFLKEYMNVSADVQDFNEMQYLRANDDVHAAVRRGELESGYQHWIASGRQEGRPIRRPGQAACQGSAR